MDMLEKAYKNQKARELADAIARENIASYDALGLEYLPKEATKRAEFLIDLLGRLAPIAAKSEYFGGRVYSFEDWSDAREILTHGNFHTARALFEALL